MTSDGSVPIFLKNYEILSLWESKYVSENHKMNNCSKFNPFGNTFDVLHVPQPPLGGFKTKG